MLRCSLGQPHDRSRWYRPALPPGSPRLAQYTKFPCSRRNVAAFCIEAMDAGALRRKPVLGSTAQVTTEDEPAFVSAQYAPDSSTERSLKVTDASTDANGAAAKLLFSGPTLIAWADCR